MCAANALQEIISIEKLFILFFNVIERGLSKREREIYTHFLYTLIIRLLYFYFFRCIVKTVYVAIDFYFKSNLIAIKKNKRGDYSYLRYPRAIERDRERELCILSH